MYAIMTEGGRQYRVQEGDRIQLDYRNTPVGERLEFHEVLLCSGPQGTVIGTPRVEGAVVVGEVVDHPQGPKLKIQKFRRRKKYRRLTGHRQQYIEVRIQEIRWSTESSETAERPKRRTRVATKPKRQTSQEEDA